MIYRVPMRRQITECRQAVTAGIIFVGGKNARLKR
jgi:hypothetical protein